MSDRTPGTPTGGSRERMSEIMRAKWADPEWRARLTERFRQSWTPYRRWAASQRATRSHERPAAEGVGSWSALKEGGMSPDLLEVLFQAMERHVYDRCTECRERQIAGRLSGCSRYQRMWRRYTRITHGALEARLRSQIYANR